MIALVIVATGNHFVLDVVVGVVAVLLGYAAALLFHRPPQDRLVPEASDRLGPGSDESLTVALVCPYDWEVPGGVRTHVAGLAEALRARGHRVDILAAGRRSSSCPGLTLVGTTTPVRANGSVARVALGPRAARRVARALGEGSYDVVHLHEPLVPSVCLSALLHRRSALVATFHMYSATAVPYRTLKPVLRMPLRRLSSRIAVSESARECAARLSPEEFIVIPNGIPPARRPNGRREENADPGACRRILFVGRHEPRKGLAVLLRAFADLASNARLDLIGVTPDEIAAVDLDAWVRERVHPRGRVSDEERSRLLRRADVLCAPSLHGESFGLVLVEAMAEGVPVVASAIPGYRDVLPTRCGRLVPPGDQVALARALADVLGDSLLRRRLRSGAVSAVAAFEWPSVAARIEHEYRRAIVVSRSRTSDVSTRLDE